MLFFLQQLLKMREIHEVNIYHMLSIEEAALDMGDVEMNKVPATLSRASPSSRGEGHVNKSLQCHVQSIKLERKCE